MKALRKRVCAVLFFAAFEVTGARVPVEAFPQALRESDIALAVKTEDVHFRKHDPSQFASQAVKTLADTPAGREKRSFVTDVTYAGGPSSGSRRAVVTRYEYSTGLTYRTTVDLSSEKVVAFRASATAPAPLAHDEVAEAIKLAVEFLPTIRKSPDTPMVARPMHQGIPDHPLYGHRLVVVTPDELNPPRRAVVDLTMKKVLSKTF